MNFSSGVSGSESLEGGHNTGSKVFKLITSFRVVACRCTHVFKRKSSHFKSSKCVTKSRPTCRTRLLIKLTNWSFVLYFNKLPSIEGRLLNLTINTKSCGNGRRSTADNCNKLEFPQARSFKFLKNLSIFLGTKVKFCSKTFKISTSLLFKLGIWTPVTLSNEVELPTWWTWGRHP